MDPITLIAAAAVLILWFSALVSISNNPFGNATNITLWALIATLFPVVGALMWFGMGRKALKNRP